MEVKSEERREREEREREREKVDVCRALERNSSGAGMITYRKGFPSPYSLLLRIHGAAWIRTILPAVVSAVFVILLNVFVGDGSHVAGLRAGGGWRHPYTYQTFAFIVGFSIVFRNGSAYQRYTQARNNLQTVTGKLTEAVVQICTFDLVHTIEGKVTTKEFRREFIHLIR